MAWLVDNASQRAKQEKELLARTLCKGHCGHFYSGKQTVHFLLLHCMCLEKQECEELLPTTATFLTLKVCGLCMDGLKYICRCTHMQTVIFFFFEK